MKAPRSEQPTDEKVVEAFTKAFSSLRCTFFLPVASLLSKHLDSPDPIVRVYAASLLSEMISTHSLAFTFDDLAALISKLEAVLCDKSSSQVRVYLSVCLRNLAKVAIEIEGDNDITHQKVTGYQPWELN